MRSEEIRFLLVIRRRGIGFYKDPIKLETTHRPHRSGCSVCCCKTLALTLIGIAKGAFVAIDHAFRIAAKKPKEPDRDVRLACRDIFRQTNLLERIIPTIEDVLAAGELAPPAPHEEAVPIAIPNKEGIADAGHRG